MCCWRRVEKISWTDRVRNEEVLLRVKEERNIVQTVNGREDNWIGHIWHRNCVLKHVIDGKMAGRIEVTGIRGIRGKQLLDDLEIARRNARSPSVENRLWERLWTSRKAECGMIEWMK